MFSHTLLLKETAYLQAWQLQHDLVGFTKENESEATQRSEATSRQLADCILCAYSVT